MSGIQAQFRSELGDFSLDVDLQLPGRGVIALFGHSGSGKTTVLRAIAGLEQFDGRLVVKNQEFQSASEPLDADCACPVCRRHSRAYVRHLFQAREILAPMLATLHNLHFYADLMARIRRAIRENSFAEFAHAAAARWQEGEARRLAEVARRRP